MKIAIHTLVLLACLTACPWQSSDTDTDVPPTPTTTTVASEFETDDGGSTGHVAICDASPGKAMGPCKPGNVCDDGLVCLVADNGTFCSPPCAECHAHEHDACIEHLSGKDEFICAAGKGCVLPCNGAADCESGPGCQAITLNCMWKIFP